MLLDDDALLQHKLEGSGALALQLYDLALHCDQVRAQLRFGGTAAAHNGTRVPIRVNARRHRAARAAASCDRREQPRGRPPGV